MDAGSDSPGFVQGLHDIYQGLSTYLQQATFSNGDNFIAHFSPSLLLSDFVDDLGRYLRVSFSDVVLSVALALLFTLTRHVLTAWVFKPLAVHLKLKEANAHKFPESVWKCLYYVIICSYLLHVVIFSRHNHYFYQPYEIWKDYFTLEAVPTEVAVAFLLEFSYYLHSVYGTLYMDLWRKDSPVMLFHHFLCLLLIGFSYSVRYHKAGLLLMFVHDFADVFLEFSKCQVYMKYRDGRYIVWHDIAASISFGLFALAWFVGRLYLFPLIVMRSSSHSALFNGPLRPLPFYLIFNVLLTFMLALNIYWFILIMKFFYKILSGQMKDLDDIRDYDVEMKMRKKKGGVGGDDDDCVVANGGGAGSSSSNKGRNAKSAGDCTKNNVGGDDYSGDDNDARAIKKPCRLIRRRVAG